VTESALAAGGGWNPRVEDLEAIRLGSASVVQRTPVFSSAELSRRGGGRVVVKAENLQRTGSFKLRGAFAKLQRSDSRRLRGVVCASAGNHGQAVAYAARARGLSCVVFMPLGAVVSKLDAVEAFGAEVRLVGTSIDECIAAARQLARAEELLWVHPFDDLEVIEGQAGVGLELSEQLPDAARVIVPVGGGGLICGVAAALRATDRRPRIVGVQAAACAPFVRALRGEDAAGVLGTVATIADGIAVKGPGELTLALAERWVDDMVVVGEDAIAEAMVLLAERSKLVVEGAGAVGVAALLSGAVGPLDDGTTAVVLSGGNVDAQVLAGVINRDQTRVGRRTRLFIRISDRPGGLVRLLAVVAEAGGNVLDLTHVRDGVSLDVQETGVELTVETRNPAHLAELVRMIKAAGYTVE
jgi:threonine dehydratase